jgi:hypothetical protein
MRTRACLLAGLVVLTACGTSAGKSGGTAGGSAAAGKSGGTAGGSAAAGRTCGPSAGETLARDSRARVYALSGSVYGCTVSGRHAYRLGSAARTIREGRVGPVALAGIDVAFGLTSYGVDTGSAQVVVRRLSDGRQLHSDPAVSRFAAVEAYQSVDAVVVKADGAVAWIAAEQSIVRHAGTTEVQKHDSRGRALLDQSAGIDTRSLRLHGSRLSWRDGGRTRTATLS